jgi:agmatine deiminase
MMAWPYGDETFSTALTKVEGVYTTMVLALSRHEHVHVVVRNEDAARVNSLLHAGGALMQNVTLHMADYADVWVRDWGPTFIRTSTPSFVKWRYNAYGNKFPELLKDDAVVQQLDFLNVYAKEDAGFVLEGGSIDTNGSGVILTSEETLLNANRNPQMTKKEIEQRISTLLGAESLIWLRHGLKNDHTDGHIDEIARFVSPTTIVYAWDEQPGYNNDVLSENLEILKVARSTEGEPFELIPLQIPHMSYQNGEPAPLSYCNFYVANRTVLVPQFGVPEDAAALKTFTQAFPDRSIVPIDAGILVFGGNSEDPTAGQGGGGIHCITQQIPA